MDNSVQTNNVTEKLTVDEAWKYLENHTDQASNNVNSDELRVIRSKVDRRILPLMFLCYTMQFLDKVLINVCLQCYPASSLQISKQVTEDI